jgi:hypothetical protein
MARDRRQSPSDVDSVRRPGAPRVAWREARRHMRERTRTGARKAASRNCGLTLRLRMAELVGCQGTRIRNYLITAA